MELSIPRMRNERKPVDIHRKKPVEFGRGCSGTVLLPEVGGCLWEMHVADEIARSGFLVFLAACLLALQATPGRELAPTEHR